MREYEQGALQDGSIGRCCALGVNSSACHCSGLSVVVCAYTFLTCTRGKVLYFENAITVKVYHPNSFAVISLIISQLSGGFVKPVKLSL